ncbi:MAG: AEC family transporter [Peptostreptococcaceae bacterium]|nr:AEC family transporter [Peptostreptococcaceae bacterium]
MVVVTQVLILFFMIITGFVAKRFEIIKNEMNEGLINLVLYVMLPSLILTSMDFDFSPEILAKSGKIFVISIVIYSVIMAISFLIPKIVGGEKSQTAIYQYAFIFVNVAYMGYPVVNSVYGKIGVFYTAIFNLPFNLFIWTVGLWILTKDHEEFKGQVASFEIKRFLNPAIIAVFAGFILFLFSIRLPQIIYDTLGTLGSATMPLSMIFIGSVLADVEIKDILTDKKALAYSVLRQTLVPLVILYSLKALGFTGYMVGIPAVISGMPTAANTALMASKYKNDYHLASRLVFVSTFVSIFTIPVIVMLV